MKLRYFLFIAVYFVGIAGLATASHEYYHIQSLGEVREACFLGFADIGNEDVKYKYIAGWVLSDSDHSIKEETNAALVSIGVLIVGVIFCIYCLNG